MRWKRRKARQRQLNGCLRAMLIAKEENAKDVQARWVGDDGKKCKRKDKNATKEREMRVEKRE